MRALPRIVHASRLSCLSLAAIVCGALATAPVRAATYTWGTSGTGGDGTWTSTGGWWDGSNQQTWVSSPADSAIFAGTPGTVTLGGNVTSGSVLFTVDGFTITGNTLTLNSGFTANGSATVGSNVALNANQSWSVASGKTLTVGGTVSGASTLTYGGSGTYAINGINTNNGNLTIDAATVTVASGATLFGATNGWAGKTVTLQNGGTLIATNFANGAGNLWGQIGDGSNNIIFGTGGGTFTMTGTVMDSSVNKGFTVNSGVTGNFTVSTGVSSTWSGSYSGRDFTVNGTLAFGGGGNFTTSRIITGGGGVTKNGTGTVTLTGANNFTGQTLVKSGTLALAGGQFGNGSGNNTSRAISIGPTAGDNGTFTVSSGTISQTSSAGLMIADSGTGTFNQSGGSVTLGSSGLWLGDNTTGVGTANLSGGAFTSTGATTVVATRNRGTINVSGSANVILSTLQMGHAAGGTSQVATVNLDGGSLTVDQVTKANGTASFFFNSGTLTARSSNASFMTGLNTAEIKAGGAVINTGAFAITIGQALNQNAGSTGGGLTKLGAGTLTLSAINGFTGALNVSSGTLEAAATTSSGFPSAIGSGGNTNTVTVGSGATLIFTGARSAGYHSAAATINGGTIIGNGSDLSFAAGATVTFATSSGTFSGTGQWRRRDANNQIVVQSAASGSVISINELNLLDSSPQFNVADGAAAVDLTVSSTVTGGANLLKTGVGTMLLSSAGSTYSGVTTVRAGTLAVGANAPSNAAGAFGNATSAIVLGDGSTGAADAPGVLIGGAFTVGRAITIGSVSNGAAYTPVLGGTNTSGTATFGGSVTLNTTASAYTGLNLRAAPGGTVEFTGGTWTTNNKPITVGAAGSTGTVRVSNPLATTGGVTVSAGTLQIGAANAIGDSTPVTLAGGTLDVGGVADTIGTLSGSTGISGGVGSTLTVTQGSNTTFSGTIGGSVALVKAGAATLSLSAANTLAGGVTVASGSLALVGGANRLPTVAAVVLGSGSTSGVLVLGDGSAAANQTLAALTVTGSGGRVVGGNASASTLTLDIAGANTFAGGLGGAGTNENSLVLVKTGAGSLTLSGPTTYTGNTTVSAGSLVLASGVSLASPTTTVSSGATLGGSGTAGATVVSNGGILAPGSSGVGTLTLGNLTFGATFGNTATVSIPTTGSSSIPATLQVNGDVVTNGGAGNVTFAFGSLSLVPTGTYSLITYTGSLASGTTPFAFTGGLSGRQGVSFENPTGALNLVITNAFPIWTGSNSGFWSGSDNWKLNTDSAPTSFAALDTVVFGDGVTTGTVTISGSNVNPVTTTFSANSQNYLLDATGGFGISTGNLIKSGSATVTIANTNSFDGGTLVSGGSLVLTGSGGLGTGSVTVSGGALSLTNAGGLGTGSVTVSGGLLAVTGAGQLGSNAVSLTSGTIQAGSDTALGSGTVSLSGGVLSSDSSTPRSLANRVAVGGNATLGSAVNTGALTLSGTLDLGAATPTLTMPSNVTLSGAVVNGGFVKAGGGTLTVSGSNAYSGGTTLSAGAIRVGNDAALGSGGLTLSSGTLSSDSGTARSLANAVTVNGNVALGDATNAGNLTLSGGVDLGGTTRQLTLASNATLSGIVANGGLSKAGAGLLTLSNANSYSLGTTLSAGTIAIGNNTALGSGAVTLSGGRLRSDSTTARSLANALVFASDATFGDATNNGTLAFSGTVGLGGTARTITTDSNLTLSGTVSNGGITKAGSGVLTLSAVNTYTGKTAINAGTVSIAADSGLGTAPGSPVADQLSFNGGTLRITAANQTLAANRGITLGAGGGTIDTSSISGAQTATIAGVIAGTGPLTFRSTGDQSASGGGDGGRGIDLVATNTFTGTITVASGFLSYASNAAFGNAANQIILTGGGLLDNGANVALTRPIVISAGTSTFRTYGGAAPTWSSPISGGATVNRTDGGTLTLTGDLSGFTGTYDNQAGSTVLSGGAAGLGAGARLRVSASTVTFASGRLGSGTAVMNGGTLRWASGNTDGSVNLQLVNGVTATLDTNGNNVNLVTDFGAGTSGRITKIGGGTLTLSGSYGATGSITVSGGTLDLAGTVTGPSIISVVAATLSVSSGSSSATAVRTSDDSGAVSTVNHTGGTLAVLGTDNSNSTTASLLLGHWGGGAATTWNMSAGTLNSTGAMMSLGWDGTATVNQSGGTANLLGINLANTRNNAATYNLTGGRLNLGSSGITANAAKTVNLGSGTVGALANWSTSQTLPLTSAAPGVTFDPSGFTITLSGTLTGGGALNVLGTGTLALSAANTYTGNTTVAAGVLALSGAGSLASNSAVNLSASGATLDISAASGARTIGSFAGAAGSAVVLGSNGLTAGNAANTTFAGTISGAGGLTKVGAGTLTLSGSNAHAGGSTISAGVLEFAAGGLGSGTATVGAATLRWAAGNTQDVSASGLALVNATTATLDVGSNNVTLGSGFGAGSTAGVTKAGAGTLTFANAGGYTGPTTVAGGTLAFTGAGAIAASSAVNLQDASSVLDISGASGDRTIGGLAGAAGSQVLLGGNTLTTGGGFFDGVIAGSGGLTMTGGGLLGLTDTQTFTGATRIEAGTLSLGSATALASSSGIFAAAGTTLDVFTTGIDVVSGQTLGGYGTVSGDVNQLAGSILSPGGSVGTLPVTGNVTFSGSAGFKFDVTNAVGSVPGTDWDLLTATSLNITSSPANRYQILLTSLTSGTDNTPGSMSLGNWDSDTSYQWLFVQTGSEITSFTGSDQFTFNYTDFLNTRNGEFSVVRGDSIGQSNTDLYIVYAAIPEPGTLLLAAIGLAGAGLVMRRKRRGD